MNKIAKYFISILFTIAACVTASSVGAQAWSYGTNNCISGLGCQCSQGQTNAQATGYNCTYSSSGVTLSGCWSSNTSTCGACGTNGTATLGYYACFFGTGGLANAGDPGYVPEPGCSSNSNCAMYDASCETYDSSDGQCSSYSTGPTTGGASVCSTTTPCVTTSSTSTTTATSPYSSSQTCGSGTITWYNVNETYTTNTSTTTSTCTSSSTSSCTYSTTYSTTTSTYTSTCTCSNYGAYTCTAS